jgi:hypothetical protein
VSSLRAEIELISKGSETGRGKQFFTEGAYMKTFRGKIVIPVDSLDHVKKIFKIFLGQRYTTNPIPHHPKIKFNTDFKKNLQENFSQGKTKKRKDSFY